MITVTVFGNLKTRLKKLHHVVHIGNEEKTSNYVLKSLIEKFGRPLRQELLDYKGEIKVTYSIFVNGINVTLMSGLNTKLSDKDTVAILPIVVGG